MDITKAFASTFANENVIRAVVSTIAIILLGFYLRKRGTFGENFGKVLTKVVLAVALPALAFNSFMQGIDYTTFRQSMNVLIWGIVIYIILIFATKLLYFKYGRDKQDVLRVLTDFGSTTFFGIPIVAGIYGPTSRAVIYASVFNIGYRIFLYSYGYIKMSGLKMEIKNLKQMFLNPIVVATFAGLVLWLLQNENWIPHLSAIGADGKAVNVAFYRIDLTAPWISQPLVYLSGLASPLAWLGIGSTLGSISLGKAATDRDSWYYSFNKVVLVPLINVILLAILAVTNILPVSAEALETIIIMMATPTAAVASTYAIGFDRQAVLASNASLLSTVVATVLMPFWIIIAQVLSSTGIFH
ncbi:AEC family transporter [Oenococcus alcoholitolerans]|uniref:Malate permease n=1 Tax=Oenococcus alcoholitolerans TaxID=931074 RepID=A0ABR4XQR8_9LACO|nr:malate permease [Oenococcus alcoholitolerans]